MNRLAKKVIIPEGGAKPLAPYSPGIRWDRLVFCSGQIGINPKSGKLVTGGVGAETRQALINLSSILEASGSSIADVLKVTVYLNDIEDYTLVNQIYGEFFVDEPPARSVVQGALPGNASVEFDAIAVLSD